MTTRGSAPGARARDVHPPARLRHRRRLGARDRRRDLRLPHDHRPRPRCRSATAGSRRCGRWASCSAPAPASRSSRRCRGRSPAGPPAGVGGAPARPAGGDRDRASSPAVLVVAALLAGPWLVDDLFDGEDAAARRAGPAPRRLHARVPRARRARRELALRAVRASCSAPRAGAALLVAAVLVGRRRRDRGPVRHRARASRRSSACSSRSASATASSPPGRPRRGASSPGRSAGCSPGRCSRRRSSTPARSSCSCSGPKADDDGDRSVPREPGHRSDSGLPVPRGAGRAAAAPRRATRARARSGNLATETRRMRRSRSARSAWSRRPARGCSARRS